MYFVSRTHIFAVLLVLFLSVTIFSKTAHPPRQMLADAPKAAFLPAPSVLQQNPPPEQPSAAEASSDAPLSTYAQAALSFVPFIPSHSVQATPPARSGELHDYGNSLGNILVSFTNMHSDFIDILARHATNRSDAQAIQAVQKLSDEYERLGDSIEHIVAPEKEQVFNTSLAVAYREMGKRLRGIAESTTDTGFLAAVEAHNASADVVAQKLALLSSIFKLNGVTFTQDEAGYMFVDEGGL